MYFIYKFVYVNTVYIFITWFLFIKIFIISNFLCILLQHDFNSFIIMGHVCCSLARLFIRDKNTNISPNDAETIVLVKSEHV